MNAAKTSKRRSIRVLAALSVATLSLAAPAQAQPLDSVSREAATALAVAGLEAYEAGSYEEALDKLEKSYAVARVPTLGLWSARTLHKLGRWREAEERYREAIGLGVPDGERETQQRALLDAQSELAALTPTIPTLVIQVEGVRLDEIELRIDGKPVNTSEAVYRLDPGVHHVEGSRGDAHETVDVQLVPRDTRTILLRFTPQPTPLAAPQEPRDPPSNWLRTSGWTAIGVGGAGVAVGTVGLILAIQKKDKIDRDYTCKGVECPPSRGGLIDSYNSRRDLSTAGFVIGGVLGAAGVFALWLGGEPGEPGAQAVFSPAFTGLRGSF